MVGGQEKLTVCLTALQLPKPQMSVACAVVGTETSLMSISIPKRKLGEAKCLCLLEQT